MSSIEEQELQRSDAKTNPSVAATPGPSKKAEANVMPNYRRRAFETRYGSEVASGDEQEVPRQDDV